MIMSVYEAGTFVLFLDMRLRYFILSNAILTLLAKWAGEILTYYSQVEIHPIFISY